MTAAAIVVTDTDLILLAAALNEGFLDNHELAVRSAVRPIEAAAAV